MPAHTHDHTDDPVISVIDPTLHHIKSDDPVISVIVPTLHHIKSDDPLFARIGDAIAEITHYEIIVVEGESPQNLLDESNNGAPKQVTFVYRQDIHDLAGLALHGVQKAKGEVIIVTDDTNCTSQAIHAVLQPILEDSCDISIGSLSEEEQRTHSISFLQKCVARCKYLLAMPFVDVRHPFSGFFAARRNTIVDLSQADVGEHFLLALLAKQPESTRICEAPVSSYAPQSTTPTNKLSAATSYIQQLARLAGAVATGGSTIRFGIVGLLGVGVDLSIFLLLTSIGYSIGTAHICSFFAATIFNYILNDTWSFRLPQSNSPTKLTITKYITYLFVCVAALFVRGGVLATGVELGLPSILAVVLAIAFATGINFLGSTFFVFTITSKISATIRWRMVAVAVVFYSLALRVAYIASIDLLPEEAYYWNYAKHLDLGYLDHPPMIAWLIAISTAVFGDTETAIRIPVLICWCITLGFIVALTKRIAGRSAAFYAGAFMAIFPFFLLCGFIATPDCPLMVCWAGSLYFLHRAIKDREPSAWIGFGIAIGLGLLSKYTIAIMGPVALTAMFLDRDARHWFRSPYPYIGACIALLLFSPVLIWNAQHEWASFAFQSVRRLNQTPEFGLHILVGSWFLLLTPVGIISAIRALTIRATDTSCIELKSRRILFIAACVPLVVFFLFSIRHEPKLNWTGPLWLALFPLMTLDLVPAVNRISRNRSIPAFPTPWKITFIGSLLLYGAGFHYLALGIPGIGYSKNMPIPTAWEEFGEAVSVIEKNIQSQIDGSLIVVGMDHYFITSELNFYRATSASSLGAIDDVLDITTTRNLFGMSGLMYETWTPANTFIGTNCLLIGSREDAMPDKFLNPYFDELSDTTMVTVIKNKHDVHTFYWRVGTRYHLVE